MQNDRTKIRMYVKYFTPEKGITLSAQQSHYLRHVMRVKNNDRIRVFTAEMGEFIAEVQIFQIIPIECVRHPEPLPPLTLLAFSLLRPHLTHLVVEKATELGVSPTRVEIPIAEHPPPQNRTCPTKAYGS